MTCLMLPLADFSWHPRSAEATAPWALTPAAVANAATKATRRPARTAPFHMLPPLAGAPTGAVSFFMRIPPLVAVDRPHWRDEPRGRVAPRGRRPGDAVETKL